MLPKNYNSGLICHKRYQQWSIRKIFGRL